MSCRVKEWETWSVQDEAIRVKKIQTQKDEVKDKYEDDKWMKSNWSINRSRTKTDDFSYLRTPPKVDQIKYTDRYFHINGRPKKETCSAGDDENRCNVSQTKGKKDKIDEVMEKNRLKNPSIPITEDYLAIGDEMAEGIQEGIDEKFIGADDNLEIGDEVTQTKNDKIEEKFTDDDNSLEIRDEVTQIKQDRISGKFPDRYAQITADNLKIADGVAQVKKDGIDKTLTDADNNLEIGDEVSQVKKDRINEKYTDRYVPITDDYLKIGDEVAVKIEGYATLKHHGIVVRGDKVVKIISFTSDTMFKGGTVKEQSIGQFTRGKQLYRVEYTGLCNQPEEVERLARYLLDHPHEYGEYHLWHNNCQHRASYCKSGEEKSSCDLM